MDKQKQKNDTVKLEKKFDKKKAEAFAKKFTQENQKVLRELAKK